MNDLIALGNAVVKLMDHSVSSPAIRHQLGISEYKMHKAMHAVGRYKQAKPKPTHTRKGKPVSTWPELRAKLLSDGRKALAMIEAGHKPRDALMVIGGSRARLYRAMELARQTDGQTPADPLLL
jgi:hypothetical protein